MVDVLGRPAADTTAAMQEDFEEADDARVVDLDAGIAHRADGDRKSKAKRSAAECYGIVGSALSIELLGWKRMIRRGPRIFDKQAEI